MSTSLQNISQSQSMGFVPEVPVAERATAVLPENSPLAGKVTEILPADAGTQSICTKALRIVKNELFDNQDIAFKWDAWNDLGGYFSNWGQGIVHSYEIWSKDWRAGATGFLAKINEIDHAVEDVVSSYTCDLIGDLAGFTVSFLFGICGCIYYLIKKLAVQPAWQLSKILIRSLGYFLYMFIAIGGYLCYRLPKNYFERKKEAIEKQGQSNQNAMAILQKQIKEGDKLVEKATCTLIERLKDKSIPEKKRQKAFRELAEATIYQAKVKAKCLALKIAQRAPSLDVEKVLNEEEQSRRYFYSKLQTVHIGIRTDIRYQMGSDADAAIADLERHLLDAAVDEFYENIHLYAEKSHRDKAMLDLEEAFTRPVSAYKPVGEALRQRLIFFCQEGLKGCTNVYTLLTQELNALESEKEIVSKKEHEFSEETRQEMFEQRSGDAITLWTVYKNKIGCVETLLSLSQDLNVDLDKALGQSVEEAILQHKDRLPSSQEARQQKTKPIHAKVLELCLQNAGLKRFEDFAANIAPALRENAALAIEEAKATGNYYKHLRSRMILAQEEMRKVSVSAHLDAAKQEVVDTTFLVTLYEAIIDEFIKDPSDAAIDSILAVPASDDSESKEFLLMKMREAIQAHLQQKKMVLLQLQQAYQNTFIDQNTITREVESNKEKRNALKERKDNESQIHYKMVSELLLVQEKQLAALEKQRNTALNEIRILEKSLPMLEALDSRLKTQAAFSITEAFEFVDDCNI